VAVSSFKAPVPGDPILVFIDMAGHPYIAVSFFERQPMPARPCTLIVIIPVHPRVLFVRVASPVSVVVPCIIAPVPFHIHVVVGSLRLRLPVARDVYTFVIHVGVDPNKPIAGWLAVEALDHLTRLVEMSGNPHPTVLIDISCLLGMSRRCTR
tara:strand:+ start:798 stop:1256 length:459 start_codon:yes stop_codon:yes gene_type:complete